jgi:hypothetical protein
VSILDLEFGISDLSRLLARLRPRKRKKYNGVEDEDEHEDDDDLSPIIKLETRNLSSVRCLLTPDT